MRTSVVLLLKYSCDIFDFDLIVNDLSLYLFSYPPRITKFQTMSHIQPSNNTRLADDTSPFVTHSSNCLLSSLEFAEWHGPARLWKRGFILTRNLEMECGFNHLVSLAFEIKSPSDGNRITRVSSGSKLEARRETKPSGHAKSFLRHDDEPSTQKMNGNTHHNITLF